MYAVFNLINSLINLYLIRFYEKKKYHGFIRRKEKPRPKALHNLNIDIYYHYFKSPTSYKLIMNKRQQYHPGYTLQGPEQA